MSLLEPEAEFYNRIWLWEQRQRSLATPGLTTDGTATGPLKPIHMTEYGWQDGTGAQDVNELTRAAYTSRSLIITRAGRDAIGVCPIGPCVFGCPGQREIGVLSGSRERKFRSKGITDGDNPRRCQLGESRCRMVGIVQAAVDKPTAMEIENDRQNVMRGRPVAAQGDALRMSGNPYVQDVQLRIHSGALENVYQQETGI